MYRSVFNHTDVGFLNHSLAVFKTEHFPNGIGPINSSYGSVPICRYPEYRNPPDFGELSYKRPSIYWHILAFRLAFVVVFQVNISLFFTYLKPFKFFFWTIYKYKRLFHRFKIKILSVFNYLLGQFINFFKKLLIFQLLFLFSQ